MESLNPTHSLEDSIKAEEAKRRKREGIVIAVAALMVAALIFFEVQSPDISLENSLGSNIVFFFIININIILLVLLVFLVVRNLVKLVFERRRRLARLALAVAPGLGFRRAVDRAEPVVVRHRRRLVDPFLRPLVRFQGGKRPSGVFGNRPDLLSKFRQQRDVFRPPVE